MTGPSVTRILYKYTTSEIATYCLHTSWTCLKELRLRVLIHHGLLQPYVVTNMQTNLIKYQEIILAHTMTEPKKSGLMKL